MDRGMNGWMDGWMNELVLGGYVCGCADWNSDLY